MPKGLKARKLEGQYLGGLRALGAGDRAKIKAVAKDKGVAESVKLALALEKKAEPFGAARVVAQ